MSRNQALMAGGRSRVRSAGTTLRARTTVGSGRKMLASMGLSVAPTRPLAARHLPLTGHRVGKSAPDGNCMFDSIAQAYAAAPLRVRMAITRNMLACFAEDGGDPGWGDDCFLEVDAAFLRDIVAKQVLLADPTRDEIIAQMHTIAVDTKAAMADPAALAVYGRDGEVVSGQALDAEVALDQVQEIMGHMAGCDAWSPTGTLLDRAYRRRLCGRLLDPRRYWGDHYAWQVLETIMGIRLLVVEKTGTNVRDSRGRQVSRSLHRVHMGIDHGEDWWPSHFLTLYKAGDGYSPSSEHYMPLWFGKQAIFAFEDIPSCLVEMCGRDYGGTARWYVSLRTPPAGASLSWSSSSSDLEVRRPGLSGTPSRRR